MSNMNTMMAEDDDDLQVERDENGNIAVIDPTAADESAGRPEEIGDDQDSVLDEDGHDDNLAEAIAKMDGGEQYLAKMASDMIDAIERDDNSRAKWKKTLANGIRLMGVSPDRVGGANFKNASRVVHPVLTEACVQFQARAMAEMWPPAGPVKTFIPGTETPDLRKKQKNVENYMNWQYTIDMKEAYWELDQLLFRLPLEGSAFKQQYFDAILMRTTTRFLTATDVIVSNKATDLESAPRVTVKKRMRENAMKQYIKMGIYRDVPLQLPSQPDLEEDDEIQEAIDASEGKDDNDSASSTTDPELNNEEYLNYETRVDLDLMGYEDRDPAPQVFDPETGGMIDDPDGEGEETGIALPYIVTINKDNRKVLSIVRNWAKDDIHKRKEMDLVHYKYLPGFGFYGYGLLHTIGSLSEAATGALRALLDSAAFANMQGGFKTKNIKLGAKGEINIAPGQWVDVPSTVDDIRKGLMALPYKEPSETLFKLLGALVEYAQRFASTTEAMVGESSNTGPVGTTLALIEQGSKVFSGIHKRVHKAQGEEFQQIGRLDAIHIPPEGLTFNYGSNDNTITREDFDKKIDIVPVSDPNIFSQTQRITLAQGVKQLAEGDKSGKRYDMYEVDKNLLEAMRVPNIDRFLKNPNKATPSLSPVYENMLMVQGKPVQAFIYQDHKAHMMAHEAFFAGLPPILQKTLLPAKLAHDAEHIAMLYFTQVQELTGVQLPPLPGMMNGQDNDKAIQSVVVPPELENKMAQVAAIAGQKANAMREQAQAQQQQAGKPGAPDPKVEAAAAAAKIERENQAHEADQKRKDAALERDEARKDKAIGFDLARKSALALQESRLKDHKTATEIARKPKAPPPGAPQQRVA